MNTFIPDKPVVQIYWNRKKDTFTARSNVHPDLVVDITVQPEPGEVDHAAFQGLPFEVKIGSSR